jgi:ABC-type phosphate transport system substrate-binding protein
MKLRYLTQAYSFSILSLVLILSGATYAQPSADIVVVANISGDLTTLSKNEIRQVFMGGTLSRKYHAVGLATGSKTRIMFNNKVIGLTENRIQSYWAQLVFTGRSEPPKEFDSIEGLINHLSSTKNAIGYLPADIPVPDNLVILYQK